MPQFSADRLLLGTCGWSAAEWSGRYYPDDLPDDWRLAYYANDCGCVLLPAQAWCADRGELRAALAEAPDELVFFLQVPVSAVIPPQALAPFADRRAVLLVEHADPAVELPPQWTAVATGEWQAADGAGRLVRWQLEDFDLRALRRRAMDLPHDTRALVLDGPRVEPSMIRELRTLLELLGRA